MSLHPKIARAYQTIVEMIEDRKMLTSTEMEVLKSVGPDEIKSVMARDRNAGPVVSFDVEGRLMIVFMTARFKISEFSGYLKRAVDYELCILVLVERLTAPNLRTIAEHTSKLGVKATLQTFLLDDLQFNPTKHKFLVPKHELITDEKTIEDLVERCQVKTRYHMPIILRSDPIARYFGAKVGQVMKITRVSPAAGEAIVYRCVG